MSAITRPVNRREASYYLLFAVVGLFAFAIIAGLIWYALPRNYPGQYFNAGFVTDYPPSDIPYHLRDIPGWVVNIDGEIVVFDGRTTHKPCLYAWNAANLRFEDPCHGSKYRLDGLLLEAPARRDLDRYEYSIQNGELIVHTSEIITGACRDAPDLLDSRRVERWDEWEPAPLCPENQ